MNQQEIQEALNALIPPMEAKAQRMPKAFLSFESDAELRLHLVEHSTEGSGRWHYIQGDDLPQAFENAREFINDLPDPEEAKRQEFMLKLASLIELGRENGIDVEFVNPLKDTMKRLAENAITHHSDAAP